MRLPRWWSRWFGGELGPAARVAGLYLAFSVAWIWLTDQLLALLRGPGDQWFWGAVGKGTFFVAFSALLIYWLVRRNLRELSRAQALLQAVVDETTDAVFIKDRDGKYLLFNEAAARFVGRPAAAVLGRDDTSVFDPGSARVIMARDLAVMRTGVVDTAEERLTAAGVTRTYLATKAPFRGADGAILGVVGVSRDISDRKAAEVAVGRQNAGLKILTEVMAGLLGSTDPARMVEDLFRRVSAYLECDAFFNYRADGDERLHLVAAAGLDDAARAAFRVLEPGQALCGRCAGSRQQLYLGEAELAADPDGGPVRALGFRVYACHPLLAGGRLLGTLAFASRTRAEFSEHDLEFIAAAAQYVAAAAERIRSESETRASDAFLRAFIDQATDGFTLHNDRFEVLDVNQQMCLRLGYSREELIGQSPGVFDPNYPEWLPLDLIRERTQAGESTTFDSRHRCKDGSTFPVEVSIKGFQVGGQRYAVALARDTTERLQAEELLRLQAQRFEKLAAVAPGVIHAYRLRPDGTGCFPFSSPSIADIYGAPPEALVNDDRVSRERTHTEDLVRASAAVQESARSLSVWHCEFRVHHPTRGTLWVEGRSNPIREADGGTLWYGFLMDITERKRSEEALRESEERYRRLVHVLPAAVFVHADDRIIFTNPAFDRLVGATGVESYVDRSPLDVAHPDSHEQVRTRIEAMRRTGEPVPGIELRINALDGRSVPVYSVSTPLSLAGRQAFLVALSDLTERERSIELLRSVLNSVSDAILTINQGGIIQSANPAAARMFGYPPDGLLGQNISLLMPEPHRSNHDGYIANYLRTGVSRVIGAGRESDGQRRDGTRFPVEITVTEFTLGGDRHFTGVVRDITARKRLEDQFRQSQKMEAVGRLAGGVAHDFNNVLTVINGYSELILPSFAPQDPTRERIIAIRDAGERAARLTQQLLAFSRKAIIEPKLLDLNALVSDSVRLLRRLIGEDILLSTVLDPDLGRVLMDPGQFEQMLMNLMVNARDAMPTGGRLTIETRDVSLLPADLLDYPELGPGRYARMDILDTGCGIPEEARGQIFEPFFTTKGVGKGTGLGLAVVHGVVRQAEGHIGVTSSLGEGTTFTLLLPVKPEAPGNLPGVALAPTRGTETVLLVEDEDAVRTVARMALESQGYTVLEASGGEAALRLVDSLDRRIDILVTDVVMPGVGGRQVADAFRARRPGLRVLYVSGYTDDAVVLHGVVEATDAFLQKPFTMLGLARKIRSLLDDPLPR